MFLLQCLTTWGYQNPVAARTGHRSPLHSALALRTSFTSSECWGAIFRCDLLYAGLRLRCWVLFGQTSGDLPTCVGKARWIFSVPYFGDVFVGHKNHIPRFGNGQFWFPGGSAEVDDDRLGFSAGWGQVATWCEWTLSTSTVRSWEYHEGEFLPVTMWTNSL